MDGTAPVSVPELSNICPKCDILLSTSRHRLQDFECYSYVTLEVSARSGCTLCALVFAQARVVVAGFDHTWNPYLKLPYHVQVKVDLSDRWSMHFYLKRKLLISGASYDHPQGTLASIIRLPWQDESSRILHHITHNNTGSMSSMKLAQSWMRVCQESHGECIAHSNSYHIPPTRLLDIGLSNEDLRLSVMESYVADDPKWATLSHCWGRLEFLKLSRQNLASFQKSIPYPDLPLTFKHAIEVARNFGFRFLWIDSLCIIQDDKDDWEKEAPLMARVYGGSSLNISGAAAHDGRDGLFFNRDTDLVQSCLSLVDTNPDFPKLIWDGVSKTFMADPISPKKLLYHVDAAVYDHSFGLPLFQRAWIFQERFLASRTLHFGDTQIFWECQSQICFETFPNGMPNGYQLKFGKHENWVKQRAMGSQQLWESVLAHYSMCKLTNPSDKLVAILGMAESFASRYGGTYLWGVWREHLPMALLWEPRNGTASRPLPLLAPTWSWASISGPIGPDFSYGEIARTPATSTHTHFLSASAPENRILKLQCQKLFELRPQDAHQVREGSACTEFAVPGVDSMPPVELSIELRFDGGDYTRKDIPRALYALCFFTSGSDELERDQQEYGLLIQRVEGKSGGFRRRGVYGIYRQEYTSFALAGRLPLTEHEREVVYERVCEGEDGVENKFVVNLE